VALDLKSPPSGRGHGARFTPRTYSALILALALLAGLLVLAPRSEAGVAFPPPQTLSDAGQNAFQPQVAVDPDGRATVVWSRSDGSNARIQSVRLGPDGSPGQIQTLSAAGQSAIEPQVAVDPDGSATVVWSRSDGSKSRIQSVHVDADGAPGEVFTLSSSTQDAFEPQVAVDPEGFATVVWRFFDGTNWRIQTTRLLPTGGLGFPVLTLSTDSLDASEPQVAVDSQGRATVVWWHPDPLRKNWVEAIRRADGALTGPPQVLSAEGQDARQPQVAVDSQGRATVVWRHQDGPSSTFSRIQSVRLDADGSLGAVRTLSDAPGLGPQVAIDPQDRATVVWHLVEVQSDFSHVQSVRLGVGGAPGAVLTLGTALDVGQSEVVRVAVDSQGRAVVAWDNFGFDVRVVRLDSGRTPGAEHIVSEGNSNFSPRVALDPRGRPTVVWQGHDGSNSRIQATRGDILDEIHGRRVGLRAQPLRSRGVARGRVTTPDGTVRCHRRVPVQIQRANLRRGPFRLVRRTTTNARGAYRTRVPRRPGRYRALAPRRLFRDVQGNRHICRRALSPVRRIRR
jgi:hypothetical protein